MKRTILYFFLLVFVVGVGTLIFGFWNAKKIRDFASTVQSVRAEHNFDAQIHEIEKSFSSSGKDVSQMREDSKNFATQLDEISRRSEAAGKRIQNLGASKASNEAKSWLTEYYSRVSAQAKDLESLLQFIGQNYDVAAVFSQINENTGLDEMENLISQAKEKATAITPDNVPESLRQNTQDLKVSIEAFLQKMEDTVSGTSTDSEQLNKAYADFSQKEDDFSKASKNYIDSLPDLTLFEKKIDSEVMRLQGVYFRIR